MNHYLIGSAIVPSILLVCFFHRRDLYPEPARVLWTTFFLGVLTVIPVLAVVYPISDLLESVEDPILSGAVTAFAGAAIPEEFFKYIVVVFYCSRHKAFDEPMDGVVYGVVASLGFATLENVLYVADGGYTVALLRAFTAVPGHALTGAFMGYFIGQAKFSGSNTKRNWLLAFAVPTLLHGIYDFPLMAVTNYSKAHNGDPGAVLFLLTLVVIVIFYEWIFVIRRMRRLRTEQNKLVAVRQTAIASPDNAAPLASSPAKVEKTIVQRLLGIVYLLVGAALCSLAGLMGLGLGVKLSRGEAVEVANYAVAIGLFIVLPLIVGVWLFRKGLRN